MKKYEQTILCECQGINVQEFTKTEAETKSVYCRWGMAPTNNNRGYRMKRDIWWEWYCSLFPKTPKPSPDPTLERCKCGYTWRWSKWQLILMLIRGKYIHTCPKCMCMTEHVLIYHVVRMKELM